MDRDEEDGLVLLDSIAKAWLENPLLVFLCAGALAWPLYVFLGYPLVLWLWGTIRRIRPACRDGFLPSVSVLISARNEEKDIGWKIQQTLGWDYPAEKLEIWVASDASEDRTDEIIGQFNDKRVRFLRMEARSGKNAALNRLVEQASGELLFFTDANASIGSGCLRRLARHFADKRVGCVTGQSHSVREENEHAVGRGSRVYWGYEGLIQNLESCVGSVLVCDGAIFCLRRSLFTPLSPELANDLELPLRVGAGKHWVLYEPEAVVWEKDTSSPREEFSRRRRICAQGLLATWRLRTSLINARGWQMVSRKLLRWLTLVPLALLFLLSIRLAAYPFFTVVLWLQGLFYLLAGIGWLQTVSGRSPGSLVSIPFYVVLVAVAGLVGVVDALRGRRFAVWDISAASRGREGAIWS